MDEQSRKKIKAAIYGLVAVIAYSILAYFLYLAESNIDGSNINNFSDALWYLMVTLTTVGYGNYFPTSTLGKVIGGIFVLSSLGVLGLLIGKIGEEIHQYKQAKRLGLYSVGFENHCVIIGWNRFIENVIDELVLSGQKVAILTEDRNAIDFIHDSYDPDSVYVSFTELTNYDNFSRASIQDAHRVLIGMTDDTKSLIALLNLQDKFGDLNSVVTVKNDELEDTFYAAGALHVVSQYKTAAKIAASNIYEPDVANFSYDLISSVAKREDYEFQEYYVTGANPLSGQKYGSVFKHLYDEYRCIPIALSSGEKQDRTLIKLPEDDVMVDEGDHLVLVVNGENMEDVQKLFGVHQGRRKV